MEDHWQECGKCVRGAIGACMEALMVVLNGAQQEEVLLNIHLEHNLVQFDHARQGLQWEATASSILITML